jgi:broad specificity phosphatase PhoE
VPVVHLVRHGQASFGDADYDVLSATGRQQAAVVGAALARRCPRPAVLVSGTLRRQVDTAAVAAGAAGWPVEVSADARWNEYDHLAVLRGYGTGPQPTSRDRAQQVLEAALRGWIGAGSGVGGDGTGAGAVGGDGTGAGAVGGDEPWPAFTARVRAAVTDLLAGLGRGGTAVVFTSAGVIAAVGAELLGLAPDGYLALNRVQANASVTTVVHGRSGTSLLTFNDHAHLFGSPAPVTYR